MNRSVSLHNDNRTNPETNNDVPFPPMIDDYDSDVDEDGGDEEGDVPFGLIAPGAPLAPAADEEEGDVPNNQPNPLVLAHANPDNIQQALPLPRQETNETVVTGENAAQDGGKYKKRTRKRKAGKNKSRSTRSRRSRRTRRTRNKRKTKGKKGTKKRRL